MYYKLIGCKIFEREIASVTHSCRNVIDVTLLRQKLHDVPSRLRDALQEEIDLIDDNSHRYTNDTVDNEIDAILIGYGLCSNAIIGLKSRKYPLVIPKAHDCVTLIMGSKEKYDAYHKQNPASFYYWPGSMELRQVDETESYERRYQMYIDRYKGNEKRARRIMDIESDLTVNYESLTYITWDNLRIPEYESTAQRRADDKGWRLEHYDGDDSLFRKMVNGDWDNDNFLVVQPGQSAKQSYDHEVIVVAE